MNTSGDDIQRAVRAVRKIHEDIALLLRTGEEQLGEAGWEQTAPAVITASTSTVIDNPGWWMPRFFFRYVKNAKYPHILAFVGVLLDDTEGPDAVKESMATCGWMDYGNRKVELLSWQYWFACVHCWIKDSRNDGTFVSARREELDADWVAPFARVWSSAVPLSTVTDSQILRDRLTAPLLEHIKTVASLK